MEQQYERERKLLKKTSLTCSLNKDSFGTTWSLINFRFCKRNLIRNVVKYFQKQKSYK